MRNPCRIMMRIRLTIGLCIGDEIMSGLNYKTKIMILLGLAFIMSLFAGCGSSDKFYITENQYLNTDKIRVLAKGLDPYGNQGWGVAVNQVTIDPKDGSILEEGEAWIWNFDEYDGRKLVDGAYHWSTPKLQKYTVTKDDPRYEAFKKFDEDYVQKVIKK